jgi:hypothetical protein
LNTTPAVPNGPRLLPRTDTYRGVSETSPFSALIDTRASIKYGGVPNTPAFANVPFVEYIPGRYTFQNFLNYGFALRNVRGGTLGIGTQAMPWDPKDDIDPQGTLADRVNPFRDREMNPITGLINNSFVTAAGTRVFTQGLPYRPGPNFNALGAPNAWTANGLFVPSQPYAAYVQAGGSDKFGQNFSQEDLAWNRGDSQSQTYELKEAYIDADLLEGKLFLRLGRQAIVWGKTELFATTDLFNPVDLALGSLVSLEESRIPLWAMRAIYSFYEVGPFEDVRLEVALDLDDFYPTDLGRCGEPYTPNPVCNKTYGLLVHGLAGVAIAGENRPPHWWDDISGLQGGVRLEFRWERFSFALVDFWNYTKIFYTDRLTTFARNVDPNTGRPRRYGATGACTTGAEPACLRGGQDTLLNSPLNQQLYAVICSSSVGFSGLDRTACAQSVLTSQSVVLPPTTLTAASALSYLVSGSPIGIGLSGQPAFLGDGAIFQRLPAVSLSIDPGDGVQAGPFAGGVAYGSPGPYGGFNHSQTQTLAQTLSTQQQALLGCGPFYGTSCDGGTGQGAGFVPGPGGIDLLNAEASALVQSWLGFDGTPTEGFLATDRSRAQPGTIGYEGGPVCTRVENGQQVKLPGCRSPGDPGYDPMVDGRDPRLVNIGFPAGQAGLTLGNGAGGPGPIAFTQGHPFTGQIWQSEMAALSWNLQAVLVAFSTQSGSAAAPGDVGSDPTLRFDPGNAFRTDGCSYVVPWRCSAVRAFWGVVAVTRNDLRAGGNGRFGRRDFVWSQGGDVVLKYRKRNVLGFSTDFAEDVTKTNWGMEFTWVDNNPFTNNNEFDGIDNTDQFNLTVSVDRPTFINFLNQSRTFFFNSQWFFSYVPGYKQGFTSNGPWNVFFTFTVQTGYFQDRLLPGVTWVYDIQSESGAALPSITYRFTENFSASFGVALFWGRYQGKTFPVNPIGPSNQTGAYAYREWVENGLAAIRDRDEVFMRLRYAF